VLAGISFSKQSIDLAVAELSLTSRNMSSLNYPALFKIFREE